MSTELFAFPMSFAQQRLWFLEQMNQHSASYNISGAVRLIGPLDIAALQQSLDVLVERHESLRTTFAFVEGSPAQLIAEQRSIRLELIPLDAAVTWAAMTDRLDHEARRPFDLINGPLLRAALIRRSDSEHVLLTTMHHMISDGWSIQILLRELSTLYSAHRSGQAARLPELAIQYADFSVWQRDWLTGDVLDRQLAYWKQQLADPSTLHLPTDYPRPAVQTFNGSVEAWVVPAVLVERLQTISRRERVTLFTLLLTAFQILLHRYSGQDDILVGVPVANRNRTEIEHIIGFFVNTLVVRGNMAGNPTFSTLLQQIHQTALDAYAHEDLPFEKLVDELHLDRNLSYTPLFQVAFTFQDAPLQRLTMPGVDVEALPLHTGTAKFDLTLDIEATESELRCVLEYNTDLFAPTTVARMAAHFQHLITGIADDPGLRIGSLPLVATDEHHHLLHGWNPPARHVVLEGCLHTLFERQARQHADATALVFQDQHISYGTLEQRANQLAHYLRQRGVGPDMLVGLYVERSVEMILGILGILKAGGAYVPLDPTYPRERLAFMLEDSQASLVITTQHMARDLPAVSGQVICLDAIEAELAQYRTDPPAQWTTPDNLAYIIYTSGSTGRPKGVGVTHANVLRLFQETNHWFHFDHRDVWTLFHSYAFDFSVWELWGALLYGGRLVVVPYEITRSPDAFYRLLSAEQVTVLNQTPSAFRQLIQVEEQALVERQPLALRYVIFGGEALDPSALKPWFERHGEQPQLINMYGITETTVHVTYRVITPADSATPHTSPIGCPIPDLRIYLLDRYLNPVPIGVTGEIYVGGSGLARGYLKRPDLTAERFIPDPFRGDDSLAEAAPAAGRLYKTGDTARRLVNGELHYLGRIDAQVKIRGFRIELGEIDAVLREHPQVSTSLTMVRQDALSGGHPEKRLVAYVVKKGERRAENGENEEDGSRLLDAGHHAQKAPGVAPGSADLRAFLRERLPDYMLPSAFVFLETLPLTENGKINRAALPAPERSSTASELEYVAPQTPTEELLAAVWAKVLNLPRVGIHDNFFAVGGDSILSLQILAMAKQRGISFSLQQLFQQPTIAELAQVIATDAWEQEEVHTEPLSLLTPEDRRRLPQGVEDAYPLAMLQAGTLYHMALAPESNIYHNTDSFHLRTKTPFNLALFQQAVAAVVARHSILRTGFDLTSYSEPLQLVHVQAMLPVVLEDVRHLSFEEQERLIAELIEQEKQHRFDLAKPTLLRFFVHLRTDDSFQFTLTECHSIIDGWSLHSTLVEMFQCYFALLKNEPLPDLRPLSVSFRDFVALERKALTSTEHEQFWMRTLDGASLLQIPRQHATPVGESEQGSIFTETIIFPAALHEGLQHIVRTMAVPLKSILLAAHIKVMSILGGQTDVLLGVGMNGRPETLDGAQLRGLFINAVPFRLKLEPGSWLELIQATFATEQHIMPHRRYPLAAIQQKCGFQRVYEVRFNYLHFHVLYELADALPDLQELGAIRSEGSEATLAVHFQVHPLTGHLTVDLDYDSAQLCQEQVARIGTYYTAIIAAMVADPHQQQHTFSPLAGDEQHQLLVEWSASQRQSDYPTTACLHHLFEEQAARTPELIAVVANEQRLSYADLNARANQLAHALRRHDVRPETHVALCLDRSVEMIVAVLGILKAGAAYVPLDPDQPPARLSAQIANSRPPVLITQSSLLNRLPDYAGSILCLDRGQPTIEREPHTNPTHTSRAQNSAYVIYTSGSTGMPKGVVVTHQNLVNYTWFMCRTLDLAPGLNFATVSTISADLGNTVVFSSLISGGCLHVLNFDVATNGRMFAGYLAQHQIDVLKIVPSHLRALIEAADGEQVLPRRKLILGGEALSNDLFTQLCERARGCTIINHYGPTETTIGSLVYLPGTQLPTLGSTIPIGGPIANTQVYLLDRHLLPVPAGVVGEIYIGGDGLARGYLDRPDLTAERFIPNPFAEPDGSRAGTRLYKTGDVARHLPDGTIQFMGRADQQVKLRGFRIELSEIEAVLRQHEAVRDTVVIAREDTPGEKRLVAYVVGENLEGRTENQGDDSDGSPFLVLRSSLRAFLGERLPEYMLPAAIIFLDALPLTPNGKLDRRALPVPDSTQRDATTAYTAPRTVEEELVAGIWAQVLGLARVGIHDNFFALGGHSLLATQIVGRLRALWNVDIPLRTLFEQPTVAGLTQAALRAQQATATMPVPPIHPVPRTEPLPLSFAQQRLWFLEQLHPGLVAYHLRVGVRLIGTLDRTALERSLSALAARHETLRTTFALIDNEPVQIIHPAHAIEGSTFVPIHALDWRNVSPTDRERQIADLVETEVRQPFDLTRGPLMRTSLVQLADDEQVLFLTIHHMISDGLSMQVLSRELSVLYTAYVSGQEPALPPLPVQYADYAHWQRSWLQGDVLEQRLNYWRNQLADAPKVLELPTDRPRPPIQTFTGASEKHTLSPSRTAALIALSQAEGVTLYMTLLTGFAIVLARLSGQRDLLIGSPIANRTRPEIEGLIGFFIDTVVLRIDLSGGELSGCSFHELLRRVRTTSLDAYAHQDLPFEQLIDQLQIARDLSHNPLFQVMLNMLNFEQARGETPGLTWEPLTLPDPGSKFDLTLYAHNHDDLLQLELVYNLDLFDAERMREVLRQFDLVLEQIVTNPNLQIDELSLVTPASATHVPDPQQSLTVDWTGAAHTQVLAQALRTPEQIALIDHSGAWQYGELAARTNRLAHYLRANGIQRGDIVAIYADRSAALVGAVLGVLQAGAAFTILDPAYPAPRLIELTRLAAPRGWLQLATAGPLPDELEAALATQPRVCHMTLSADGTSAELASYPDTDLHVDIGPDDLAYVAFTSGSTGQPKGILGTHRPLAHFLGWHTQTFSLDSTDRFSMLSGLAHDPLLRDLFTPLCLGATLCIPDPDDILEPGRLLHWMHKQGITITHLTPALGHVLAAGTEAAPADQPLLLALRYAFFGGDTLTGKDLLQLRRLAPTATCVNFYGATETPQAMGYAILPPDQPVQPYEQIPLGRGIDGVQLLVLTATQQLAGVGEIGEIYVRTGYLARGYLGDDPLTAEKFIADPFAGSTVGTRLYRTGDLGRYRADGSVEFAGRIDDQIKIRGFRVELSEIERTLQAHPAIADAVVLARETEPGEHSLIAYVVPKEHRAPSTEHQEDERQASSQSPGAYPVLGSADLRDYVGARLPSYMLPAAFVLLDTLPLTPNGKVDRRALPTPDTVRADTGASFVAPRSFVEEELAAIWGELLHIDQVGIHDNFFVLGGHSLLLIQLATRIRQAFEVDLPLRTLFEAPTIATMGVRITQRLIEDEDPEDLTELLQEMRDLSPDQLRLLLQAEDD